MNPKRTPNGTRLRGAFLLGALALVGMVAPASAQDAPAPPAEPAADLPEAKVVVEKMIEALGGREAMEKVTNRHSKGKFEMLAQGMSATFDEWNGGNGKFRLELDLPPFGKMEQGVTGDVVWDLNPMTGGTVHEGEMAAMQRRSARLWPILHTGEDYASLTTVAKETFEGKDCVVLEAVDLEGNKEKWFIDTATHLRVKTEATLEAPQVGKITMVTSESDWREIEGVKVPFKTLMDQSIQKIVIQVESIDFNTDVPAGKFELPGVIQKLVEKKAADEAAAGGGDADASGHDGHDHDGHDHDDH